MLAHHKYAVDQTSSEGIKNDNARLYESRKLHFGKFWIIVFQFSEFVFPCFLDDD